MKIYPSQFLAALLLLGVLLADEATCFVPQWPSAGLRQPLPASTLGMAETTATTDSDVSIPYDAAARLAYDEWRAQFNKGDFDPKRFESFKTNYETITVANVVAKKKAREEGTVSLSLMALNEFGDLSEEEYQKATTTAAAAATTEQSTPPTVTTTGDVLSKAVEAAELQNQASNALGEAADALAEEEQVRTNNLVATCAESLVCCTGTLLTLIFVASFLYRNS